VRVAVTWIGWDGTMLRRVVDTADCTDGPRWEGFATRALLPPPPYRPVPAVPLYHVSLDNSITALVAEHDLCGPLLDLVTAVLAMGDEMLARLASLASRFARLCEHLGLQIPQAVTADSPAGGDLDCGIAGHGRARQGPLDIPHGEAGLHTGQFSR
jgi:hypothetical protein